MSEELMEISPLPLNFIYNSSGTSPIAFTIKNISDSGILFKVKVNCPTNYLVKPSQGKILINEKADIEISYRGKSPEEAHGHKFLIDCVKCNDSDESSSIIWSEEKPKVKSTLIQVNFIPENSEDIKEGSARKNEETEVDKKSDEELAKECVYFQ